MNETEADVKYLSDTEIVKLDLFSTSESLHKTRHINMKNQITMAGLQIDILNLKKQLLQTEVNGLANKLQTTENERREFMVQLKERHSIQANRWGFDPISGEITESIEDTKE